MHQVKRVKMSHGTGSENMRAMENTRVCLQCRQGFESNNQLHNHVKSTYWASLNELKYPEEWTAALRAYVRRALDPINSEPGWSNAEIIEELQALIEVNDLVMSRANWDTLELPQRIDPAKLPYERHPDSAHGRPRQYEEKPTISPVAKEPGRTYPKTFHAPGCTPKILFQHEDGKPFVAHRNRKQMLIFTDGACSNNGQTVGGIDPKGGCAFVYLCSDGIPRPWNPPPGTYSMHGAFFFRLEDVGPTDRSAKPTSNRAELRAVVAALRFMAQEHLVFRVGDAWKSKMEYSELVIATDSTYVVDGATQWAKAWEENGWEKRTGGAVKNRDLWELLLHRVRSLQTSRCQISFWHIPRELNEVADRAARYAATLPRRTRFGIPPNGTVPIIVDPNQR